MNTLTKIFAIGMIALGLSACGSKSGTDTALQNQAGYYQNGQYIPGVNPGAGGVGGCGLLTSQLSFSATGAQISATDILAGNLPAGSRAPGPHGQVTISQNYFGGGYGGVNLTKQSANGTLQIMASQGGTLSGSLTLAPNVANAIAMMGGQYGQPPCVQSLAIDAIYTAYGPTGYINQALIYLVLSNSQTVGPIPIY